jgi:hypothetical protein
MLHQHRNWHAWTTVYARQKLGGIWGSRGRRFKSCQPDRETASDLRKRGSEAVLVLT